MKIAYVIIFCSFYINSMAQWSSHALLNNGTWLSHPGMLQDKLILLPIEPANQAEVYDCNSDLWSSYSMTELYSGYDASIFPLIAGNHALFLKSDFGKVYIYHGDTNSWTFENLSDDRGKQDIQVVGHRAIIPGGALASVTNDFACSNKIDIFDSDTDLWFRDTLSDDKKQTVSYVFDDYLFLGGGITSHLPYQSNKVDILNLNNYSWIRDTINNYLEYSINRINNKLFICGGRTQDFGIFSSIVDIYNISNQSWSNVTLQRPIQYSKDQVVAINNKLVIFNGYSAIVFDNNTETWDSLIVHPGDGCEAAISNPAIIVGDSIFFSIGNCGGRVDIYDTQHNTWTSHDLSKSRRWMTSFRVNDKVLFTSGTPEDVEFVDNIDIYDLVTGEWYVKHFAEVKDYFAVLSKGNQALIAGGYGGTGYCLPNIDIYNSTTNQITTHETSQGGGCDMKGQIIGSKAMLAGGTDYQVYNNTVDIYNFQTSQWDVAYLSDENCCQSIEKIGNKVFFIGKYYVDIYTDTSAATAVNEIDKNLPIQVFPNPATDHLNLLIPEGVTLPAAIELSDASGKNLLRMQATEAQSQIPIQQLPAGLYALKITAKEGTTTRKVIKRDE